MRELWAMLGLVAAGMAAACASRSAVAPQAARPSGALHLYVDALPDAGTSLRVTIASLAALSEAGEPRPIEVRGAVLDGVLPRRQRLLASGTVPAGRYRGLAVGVASASLDQGKGRGTMQTSPEPFEVPVPFDVAADGVVILTLRLQVDASVVGGVRFEPVLTAGPPGVLASGLYALATSVGDAGLVLFHKLAGDVFGILPTGPRPSGVALDVDRQVAYVASSEGDSIAAFDLRAMSRDRELPVLAGDRPTALALTGDRATLLCVLSGSNAVGVYDVPALAERFRIPVGLEPSTILVDGSGRRAYVVNTGSDTLSVVDLESGSARRSVATEDGPVFAAQDDVRGRLYVVHRNAPHLLAFSLPGLAVERRVYVGPDARAVAVDATTGRIYVGRRGTGRIEVFDPASLLPVDAIDTGGDVALLAIAREGGLLYATVPRARQVVAIRLAGHRVVATTDLPSEPAWIAIAEQR